MVVVTKATVGCVGCDKQATEWVRGDEHVSRSVVCLECGGTIVCEANGVGTMDSPIALGDVSPAEQAALAEHLGPAAGGLCEALARAIDRGEDGR